MPNLKWVLQGGLKAALGWVGQKPWVDSEHKVEVPIFVRSGKSTSELVLGNALATGFNSAMGTELMAYGVGWRYQMEYLADVVRGVGGGAASGWPQIRLVVYCADFEPEFARAVLHMEGIEAVVHFLSKLPTDLEDGRESFKAVVLDGGGTVGGTGAGAGIEVSDLGVNSHYQAEAKVGNWLGALSVLLQARSTELPLHIDQIGLNLRGMGLLEPMHQTLAGHMDLVTAHPRVAFWFMWGAVEVWEFQPHLGWLGRLAESSGDGELWAVYALALFHSGRNREAMRALEKAMLFEQTAQTYLVAGRIYQDGQLGKAQECLHKALELAEGSGDLFSQIRAAVGLSEVCLYGLDPVGAKHWADWAFAKLKVFSKRVASIWWPVVNVVACSRLYLGQTEGLEGFIRAELVALTAINPRLANILKATLVELMLLEGRVLEGRILMEEVWEGLAQRVSFALFVPLMVRVYLEDGQQGKAAEAVDKAKALNLQSDAYYVLRVRLAEYMVLLDQGAAGLGEGFRVLAGEFERRGYSLDALVARGYAAVADGANRRQETVDQLGRFGRGVDAFLGPRRWFDWARAQASGGLKIRFLGTFEANYEGQRIPFTPRNADLMYFLLHCEGQLGVEALSLLLFGEGGKPASVYPEVRRLRRLLPKPGWLKAKPLRLGGNIATDVGLLREALTREL